MVKNDIGFLKKVIKYGFVKSPCLELGVAVKSNSVKDVILAEGYEYSGTDILPGADVDYEADFQNEIAVKECFKGKLFGTVIIFNVLEHVFEPIKLLDNAFSILKTLGTAVIVTPCIWPLHNYPCDVYRLNPDFYREYAKRRKLEIVNSLFEYVSRHNINYNNDLPLPSSQKWNIMYSRVIHKLFNTCGRGMLFPSHVSIGVVIVKS
jgi:SAM-dependent methyltransferase